jgi:hypothetical protein
MGYLISFYVLTQPRAFRFSMVVNTNMEDEQIVMWDQH